MTRRYVVERSVTGAWAAEHGPQWVPAGTGCLERVTLRHRATGIEVTVASNEAESLLAWLNSPEGWKP